MLSMTIIIEQYRLMYSITGISSLFLNVLLITIIALYTPATMSTYKWFLLNITIADLSVTLLLEQFFRLVPISPTHMFLVDGHFKHLGSSATITKIFYALAFGTFYYAMYSLLACFAYRCWILAGSEGIFGFKISLTRLVQILVGYGCFSLSALLAAAFLIMEWDRKTVIATIGEEITRELVAIEQDEIVGFGFFSEFDMSSYTFFIIHLFILLFGASACGYFGAKCAALLRSQRAVMSTDTYRMHRRMLFALFLQLTYPCILVIIPMFAISVCSFILHLTGYEMGFVVLTGVGIYEFVNPLTTLCVVLPYQRTVTRLIRRLFCCQKLADAKKTQSIVVTVASNRPIVTK